MSKHGRILGFAFVIGVATLAAVAYADAPNEPPARKYSGSQRLALPRLEAQHNDVTRLQQDRRDVQVQTGLNDFRSIIHAHADDSDHTGGTRPEMLEAAKQTDVKVIMLSDHFRPPRDFIEESWRGIRDGVLFIPGSESKGYLIYPTQSVMDKMDLDGQDFVSAITADNGLIFLSHVEERTDHSMTGLTGMEIVNRHYDAKKDMVSLIAIAMSLADPDRYAEMQKALELYPDEVLAAQIDYPKVYIDKWDAEMQGQRVVGVAANDCHHNQVLVAKMVDADTILIGTIVDKDDEMQTVPAGSYPGIREMTKGKQPGDIIAKLDLDPYHIFFHDVSTHILAPELTEEAIRASLAAGHAYVSHDWMCDPTGFVFGARCTTPTDPTIKPDAIMGDEVAMSDALELVAEFPLECDYRLLKNGRVVHEAHGREVAFKPDGPGAYRLEGWLTVDEESRPWIYANPVYVRE